MDTFCCVKQSDSQVRCTGIGGDPNQRNTDKDNSTNYYDTPKYVVDVFGGAVSKTYRHLPESRNSQHIGGYIQLRAFIVPCTCPRFWLAYEKATYAGILSDVAVLQLSI